MAKKEEKSFFTEYGTVSYFGKDYFLSDFIEKFEIEEIKYDEINHCFEITVVDDDEIWVEYTVYKTIKLYLSDEQLEQMENGIMDNDIQTLMGKIKKEKKALVLNPKEQIDREVTNTGKYPTDPDELILYAEYLQEQLKETKAHLTGNIRKASLPFVFAIISIASITNAIATKDNTSINLVFKVLTGASSYLCGRSFILFGSAFKEAKDDYKEYKMLYYKLLKLRLKLEQLGLLKKGQSIKALPSVEDERIRGNNSNGEEFFDSFLYEVNEESNSIDICNEEILRI